MKFINYKNYRPVNLDLVEWFNKQDNEDSETGEISYRIVFRFISGNITMYSFPYEEERDLLYNSILKIKSLEVFIG
jgi:hypothetical protein